MLTSDYSLTARWIHTMAGPPLEGHFLNVTEGRIESFTTKPTRCKIFDLGDDVQILPAAVNAHTHLELSQVQGVLDVPIKNGRRSMADWVAELLRFRRNPNYSASAAVSNALTRQDILTDTAAVVDIVPPELDTNSIVCPNSLRWLVFRELIAWNPESVTKKLDAAGNQPFHGLAPHAPQTVCPELLDGAVRLAKARNCPLAMHLAETPEEIEFLSTGVGPLLELMRKADPDYDPKKVILGSVGLGTRPMDYLKLLAEAPKTLVIHGRFLEDDELQFLAAHRETMAVVYCPRSGHYFCEEPYPLKKMLDLGVRVLLGTDSLASTPDLSVVNEMKFVLQRHPDVPPETIFRMGTVAGTEFLQPDGDIDVAELRVGSPARFAFF